MISAEKACYFRWNFKYLCKIKKQLKVGETLFSKTVNACASWLKLYFFFIWPCDPYLLVIGKTFKGTITTTTFCDVFSDEFKIIEN